jgi:hypothetical protein
MIHDGIWVTVSAYDYVYVSNIFSKLVLKFANRMCFEATGYNRELSVGCEGSNT